MTSAPVQPNQRIQYLDVVRGFAITGVLIAYVFWNLGNAPSATYSSFDKILDQAGAFLIDSKCFTLLACLFTVGFILHMNKAGDRAGNLYIYRRRLLGLLVIGLLHALLLRNGDILAPYAILTFLVSFFYNSSNRTIILAMLITFLLEALLPLAWQWWGLSFPQRPVTAAGNYWVENFAWVKYWYATSIFYWETTLFLLFCGLLLGRFFIQNKKKISNRQLIVIAVVGFVAGTASYLIVNFYSSQIGGLPDIGNTQIVRATVYHLLILVHGTGMASAYAGIFFLLAGHFRLATLVNLGRMSLTNYILQAIIVVPVCLSFNLFDHITPSIALLMAAAIWIIQVLFSRWWLKQYRFGPLEWLLRRFTYGRIMAPKKVKEQMELPDIPILSREQ